MGDVLRADPAAMVAAGAGFRRPAGVLTGLAGPATATFTQVSAAAGHPAVAAAAATAGARFVAASGTLGLVVGGLGVRVQRAASLLDGIERGIAEREQHVSVRAVHAQ